MSLDLRHTLHASTAQLRKLHAVLREKGIGRPTDQAHIVHMMSGKDSRTQLTSAEAADLIDRLEKMDKPTLFLFMPRRDSNM